MNRRLAAGALSVSFKKPWNYLYEMSAERRRREAHTLSDKLWWTRGESNPGLVHAIDVCYRYTTGPLFTPSLAIIPDSTEFRRSRNKLLKRPYSPFFLSFC